MSLKIKLLSDSYRKHGRQRISDVFRGLLFDRTHRVVITARFCQALFNAGWPWKIAMPIAKILHKLSCQIACIDFPWRTEFGPGLAITHGWGVVVNEGAKIGANVTLFHGATIGRSDSISESDERVSGYPTIEDEVWIGPNAIIVGGITIGKGSRIAGGAFVTRSIEPNSLVIGNPCNIVKSGIIPDVFNRCKIEHNN